jgi:hypothetical protein
MFWQVQYDVTLLGSLSCIAINPYRTTVTINVEYKRVQAAINSKKSYKYGLGHKQVSLSPSFRIRSDLHVNIQLSIMQNVALLTKDAFPKYLRLLIASSGRIMVNDGLGT